MKVHRKQVVTTKSFYETQKLGENFARILLAGLVQGVSLPRSNVVALYGELGSGKTTFVQGLAKGLGIKKRIISPTFIIVRNYELKIKNQRLKVKNINQNSKLFYHVDLYRVESEEEIRKLGIEEILNGKDIIAIEWAEKLGGLLPKKRIDVYFEYISENQRKITVNKLT